MASNCKRKRFTIHYQSVICISFPGVVHHAEVDTVMQVLHDIKSLSKKHRKPHDHRHRKGKPRHSTWPQQKVISQSHYDLRKTEDTKMRPHSATSFHSSHRCDHCHASTTRSQLLDLQRYTYREHMIFM